MLSLGLCYTDTSREIEALHSAMRHQVGMETLDDTKDFTFKDTSTNQTQEITEIDGTGGFGLKPVAPSRHGLCHSLLLKTIYCIVSHFNILHFFIIRV